MRQEARVLVGRQSRGGLAARVPACSRRADARDRGILAFRHGGALLGRRGAVAVLDAARLRGYRSAARVFLDLERSEEHTSELQSLAYLVCRLLLEKKKQTKYY